MDRPILYLDHNATTAVAPEVRDAMWPYLGDEGFNPSSPYRPAQKVRAAVDRARGQVAQLLGCDPEELTFTSGATESCNTVILGAARSAGGSTGAHLVTVATEHHAVLNACKAAQSFGSALSILPVDRQGRISPDAIRSAFRPETRLVSVMLANNETGVILDVAAIGRMCRERGVLFHCDATAAIGKLPVHPHKYFCDFLSLSGHKFHGPKGVGVLFARAGVKVVPLQFGGEQEDGRRPGTENVPGIVGLGAAADIARRSIDTGVPRSIERLRDLLRRAICAQLPSVEFLTDLPVAGGLPGLCNTLSIRVPGVRNDELVVCLDREGICLSTGSACATGASLPSHVIRAMGHSDEEAREVVRVSIGEEFIESDIDRFVPVFGRAARQLAGGAYLRERVVVPADGALSEA